MYLHLLTHSSPTRLLSDLYLIVRRWLSLMLLFGAMVGLLAQEVAFASAPAMSSAAVTASQMSDECAEMMKAATSQGDKPCKGLTLDCIAKKIGRAHV